MTNSFSSIYKKIKPSIVAIASRASSNAEFPDIIGTGFIVRSDGIILTNDHVIKLVKKLPRLKDGSWPIVVIYFNWIPDKGMMPMHIDVDGVGGLKRDKPIDGYNYGPDIPDLGFIHVKVKDLPALNIAERLELDESDRVMFSSFPMGTRTLRAPGWLHQLSPTLQSGIISSILPFPCDNPHAFIIDALVQGGSSGSPVLNPSNGDVIGMIYGGIEDFMPTVYVKEKRYSQYYYKVKTAMTLAIPAKVIYNILHNLLDNLSDIKNEDISKYDTIDDLIRKKGIKLLPPKSPAMRPLRPDEVIYPSNQNK